MSRLPQLERDLVEAAARGRRRTFAALLPRVVRPVLALAALAAVVAGIALAAAQQDPEREVTGGPGVERVPQETFAISEQLTRAEPAGRRPPIAHEDLPAAAARFEARTPYPPGRRDDFDWAATPADPRDPSSITAPSDVQSLVEYRAVCLWFRYWLDADGARHPGARADAVRILRDSRRWPSRRSNDHRIPIVEMAARGEAWAVRREIDVNCVDKPARDQRYETPPEEGYEYAAKPRRLARIGDRYEVVGYMLDPPTQKPSLCLDLIQLGDGTGSGCHSATERAQGYAGTRDARLATGATGEDVDTIEVRFRDGSREGSVRALLGRATDQAALDALDLRPFTFYVAEMPRKADPIEATASRDGREVWRAAFP